MRLGCTFCLLGRGHRLEELDHTFFELFGRDTALGHELRRTEAQPLLIGGRDLVRRVDDERNMRELLSLAHPLHDLVAVHLGKGEVENHDARDLLFACRGRETAVDRVPRAEAVRLERRRDDARQIEVVFDNQDAGDRDSVRTRVTIAGRSRLRIQLAMSSA